MRILTVVASSSRLFNDKKVLQPQPQADEGMLGSIAHAVSRGRQRASGEAVTCILASSVPRKTTRPRSGTFEYTFPSVRPPR